MLPFPEKWDFDVMLRQDHMTTSGCLLRSRGS